MKYIFIIALTILGSFTVVAQTENYVTFKAEIANKNGDFIYLRDTEKVFRKIQVNKEGIFKDTLSVEEGLYQMFDGVEFTDLYLKNGYNLTLKMDAKSFDESIVYSGVGANENNYLAKATLAESTFDFGKLMELNELDFETAIENKAKKELAKLEGSNLDARFNALQKNKIEESKFGMTAYFKETKKKLKLNNTQAPGFDYVNFKGGTTKLSDLNGKYVYIDVWATWCGPCRAEIPFLKKMEEKYHDKNISFVSISIDVNKDFEKWKNFVDEKQLGGIQLFADKNWTSDFIMSFSINSIPRFILIDPNGKVVNANAARPSSPKLQTQLDELLK